MSNYKSLLCKLLSLLSRVRCTGVDVQLTNAVVLHDPDCPHISGKGPCTCNPVIQAQVLVQSKNQNKNNNVALLH